MKLANWIYYRFGNDWCGTPTPPGNQLTLEFKSRDGVDHVVSVLNDGFELWLGYPDKWHIFYRDKEARRIAWFILWTWWIKGTWFGIRRNLWYWALNKKVKQYGQKK